MGGVWAIWWISRPTTDDFTACHALPTELNFSGGAGSLWTTAALLVPLCLMKGIILLLHYLRHRPVPLLVLWENKQLYTVSSTCCRPLHCGLLLSQCRKHWRYIVRPGPMRFEIITLPFIAKCVVNQVINLMSCRFMCLIEITRLFRLRGFSVLFCVHMRLEKFRQRRYSLLEGIFFGIGSLSAPIRNADTIIRRGAFPNVRKNGGFSILLWFAIRRPWGWGSM